MLEVARLAAIALFLSQFQEQHSWATLVKAAPAA